MNYAELPGSGPPLLLLHGGSARWQTFKAILPELAASYHIYAPDLRGHGKSHWQPGSYRLQDYADDIAAFLQARVEQPAFIFGHSLGGMIALLVSARLPDFVRAVAVGDSPLSAAHWRAHLAATHEQLVAWRDLAGGQKTLPELIAILKDMPMKFPGRREPVPMHVKLEGMGHALFNERKEPVLTALEDFLQRHT